MGAGHWVDGSLGGRTAKDSLVFLYTADGEAQLLTAGGEGVQHGSKVRLLVGQKDHVVSKL